MYYSKCCARTTSSSVGGGAGHTQPSDVRRNSLAITESAKDLVCCCIIRVPRTRYIDIATRICHCSRGERARSHWPSSDTGLPCTEFG
uniref:Uncharacterized protein n=1 Tax=Trichogramma kaykai TaxID=54128 RepID=A0ABD2VUK4_9HYME